MCSVDAGYLVNDSPRVIVTNFKVKIPILRRLYDTIAHSLIHSFRTFRFNRNAWIDDVTREKIQPTTTIKKIVFI